MHVASPITSCKSVVSFVPSSLRSEDRGRFTCEYFGTIKMICSLVAAAASG